ncbi:MAG: response regulator [Chromatiaceae bacterium]|nr:response regulator [Chromatiaceae bacterium]
MAEPSTRILVVDDDAELRGLLGDYLAREGFAVRGVGDGPAMRAALAEEPVELIVLDLMLPGEDGLSLTRELRSHTEVPIIMLSARGDEVDRIVGLEVGADDYLAKPFNPRELLARMRAVLRRRLPAPREHEDRIIRFGPYRLDPERLALSRDDEPLALTPAEFALLQVLVAHPLEVLDRDRLLDLLKGYERSPFDRSIDVRIARLRAKIEPDTRHPCYIRTVWGKGYMFTPAGAS